MLNKGQQNIPSHHKDKPTLPSRTYNVVCSHFHLITRNVVFIVIEIDKHINTDVAIKACQDP